MGTRLRFGSFLVLLITAGPLAAEPPIDAARGHYLAGKAYFERGEYRRAIVEFIEAKRESNRPELDFNIATAYERTGDVRKAITYYRSFLQRRPDDAERALIEQKIAALESAAAPKPLAPKPPPPPSPPPVVVTTPLAPPPPVPTPTVTRRPRRGLVIGLSVSGGIVLAATAVTLGVLLRQHEPELPGTVLSVAP